MSHTHTIKLTPTQATQLRCWLEGLQEADCMNLMQREVLRQYMGRLYVHGLCPQPIVKSIRPSGAQLIALMELYHTYHATLAPATKVYYQLEEINKHTV